MSVNSYKVVRTAASKLSFKYLSKFVFSYRTIFGYLKSSLISFLVPIDYTRTKEIPALLDCSEILERKNDKLRILDVGSPQILSLSLSLYSDLWDITYINPFEPELKDLRSKVQTLGLENVTIVKAGITDPATFEELGSFDYVFSCSVFEHIHPEEGGDVFAAGNIQKLLKNEGVFTFSVPCSKEKFNEYREGDVYSVKGQEGLTFFQRFYDENSLHDQIITPSNLTVFNNQIIGERYYHEDDIHKRMALKIGFGWRSLILGRFFNGLSTIFMTSEKSFSSLKKPYLAIFALRKEE